MKRQMDVETARREIATTFKKNQQKQLADQLEREAAEKERFRQIAKKTREKIEEDNRRRLEAEHRAALNLKEMKAKQYEADLAAHKRIENMEKLKRRNFRQVQEVEWQEAMEWDRKMTEAESKARVNAAQYFTDQRSCKQANEASDDGVEPPCSHAPYRTPHLLTR